MNVYQYFTQKLDVEPADRTLRELGVRTPCGQSCVKAIDAAAELNRHVTAAEGTGGLTYHRLIGITNRIVQIYWRG